MKTTRSGVVWATAALLLGLAAPASAAPNRVFVSGHGVDAAGCGAPTTPCRSLQFAHDTIAADGEIDILDPAGYGAVTILKAVSIVNDGVGTAGVQTTDDAAITIAAGTGAAVYLRGLNVDGLGAGHDGVRFISGGVLTIVNCTFRHFEHDGVHLAPVTDAGAAPQFVLVGDLLADNDIGFLYERRDSPATAAKITLSQVVATSNRIGVGIDVSSGTKSVAVAISDSTLSHNARDGLLVEGAAALANGAVVVVDGTHMDHNLFGLELTGVAVAHLSRSVMTLNFDGLVASGVVSPGAVFSNGDNRLEANTNSDIVGVISAEGLH